MNFYHVVCVYLKFVKIMDKIYWGDLIPFFYWLNYTVWLLTSLYDFLLKLLNILINHIDKLI